jgi:hypothetical protein
MSSQTLRSEGSLTDNFVSVIPDKPDKNHAEIIIPALALPLVQMIAEAEQIAAKKRK